jgi:tryptophan synthase alpha chain
MNRISNAFKNKANQERQVGGSAAEQVACRKAFIGFLTAGDPSVEATSGFILDMIAGGADLIEIGIPFSDPVADGPAIERANIRALERGVTVDDVFEIVRKVREKDDTTPLVFLSYLNPVFFYGYEAFFAKCAQVGVDGIIVPDIPFEESAEVTDIADKFGVAFVTLVAPNSADRIGLICKNAKGFVYLVSSLGVTGIREELELNVKPQIESIRAVTDTPVAIGFGISKAEQAAQVVQHADGVIVGSAIVEFIEKHGEKAGEYLREYIAGIKEHM